MSANAGGLVRWPVKLILPLGFALLALQGISEIIKCVAALTTAIGASTPTRSRCNDRVRSQQHGAR